MATPSPPCIPLSCPPGSPASGSGSRCRRSLPFQGVCTPELSAVCVQPQPEQVPVTTKLPVLSQQHLPEGLDGRYLRSQARRALLQWLSCRCGTEAAWGNPSASFMRTRVASAPGPRVFNQLHVAGLCPAHPFLLPLGKQVSPLKTTLPTWPVWLSGWCRPVTHEVMALAPVGRAGDSHQ